MPWFKSIKIGLGQASVAEQLKSTRLKLGVALDFAASETKISKKYLEALELGEYHKLPDGIYGLNFVREYAQFLGLDHKLLQLSFLEEKKLSQRGTKSDVFNRQVVKDKNLLIMPQLIRNLIWIAVAIFCLIYLVWLLNNIFKPPILVVFTPGDNLVTSNNTVLVTGRTEAETEVSINQAPTMVDKSGDFNQEILLQQGINTIVIEARKGSKKTNKIIKEVLLRPGENNN